MRHASLASIALVTCLSAVGAELRPLEDGDRITGIGVWVGKSAGDFTFSKIGEPTYTLRIDPSGNRHYRDRNGDEFWVYDRDFRMLHYRGRTFSPEQQFALLPAGGIVQPGMRWTVPPHRTATHCGEAEARFDAIAEKGPDAMIDVDAQPSRVPTIRIRYETSLKCGERAPWLRTHEILFSPDFREIVESTTVNYDSLEKTNLLLADQGRGWRVQSIAYARK